MKMKFVPVTLRPAVLICSTILLMACASTPALKDSQTSGFLSDYSNLKNHETGSSAEAWRWISPDFERHNFSQLDIKPLVFFPAPATTDQISIDALNELSRQLDATVRQVAVDYQIPLSRGTEKGTLILRPALSSVVLKNKKFSPFEIIPIRLVWSAAELALGKRDKDVTVLLEYKFIDASTSEVVAHGVRQDAGVPVVNNKTQLTINNATPVLKDLVKDLKVEFKRLKKTLVPVQ